MGSRWYSSHLPVVTIYFVALCQWGLNFGVEKVGFKCLCLVNNSLFHVGVCPNSNASHVLLKGPDRWKFLDARPRLYGPWFTTSATQRRTQLRVSLAVWRPVISVSLDRWKITWFALIMEVLCLLGCDAVCYDNYNTRSSRRRVLFSQTAKMLPFC